MNATPVHSSSHHGNRSGADHAESSWPEPTPLIRPMPAAPEYPIDALGRVLGPAARSIARLVQVPLALAANSLLATAALTAQSHSNVQTLGGARPISLYVLSIAASGDRKSTSDAIALAPVHAHVRRLTTAFQASMAEYARVLEARKLQKSKARKDAASPDDYAAALTEIADEPPPRRPWIICSEPTAEGLLLSLRDGQLAQGIFSDEGGQFLGGHALSDEAELRTIAMLSRCWQGDPLDRVRARDAEHVVLYGRRVSMHLMAQPDVAARMLGRTLYRSQGFLARWLIAAPDSIAGTRTYNASASDPYDDPAVRRYHHAVSELLTTTSIEDREVGGLSPPCLMLSPEARHLLAAAYDQIETEQRPGGMFDAVREWASKSAEHSCRIAGVMSLVGDPAAMYVSGETMQDALRLTEHYLAEYQRLVGHAGVSEDIQRAQLLLDWLTRKQLSEVTARRVMQYGPAQIRGADVARAALKTLAEFGHLRSVDSRTYTAYSSGQRAS